MSNTQKKQFNKQLFLDKIKEREFAYEGEYTKNVDKLWVICSKGHKKLRTPRAFLTGIGCRECGDKQNLKNTGQDTNESKKRFYEEIKRRNFKLVGEYKNAKKFVDVVCDNGHRTQINPYTFNNGSGCSDCAIYGFDSNKSA